jgi:type VI protein secretion system component VasK
MNTADAKAAYVNKANCDDRHRWGWIRLGLVGVVLACCMGVSFAAVRTAASVEARQEAREKADEARDKDIREIREMCYQMLRNGRGE